MPRRRWIYDQHGVAHEVSSDYVQPLPDAGRFLWNDREYQDMNDPRFNSRSTHRQFMRDNGLSTMDDYKNEWAKAAKERAAWYTEGRDPSRKNDVQRALELVQQGRGRRG